MAIINTDLECETKNDDYIVDYIYKLKLFRNPL